MLEKKNLVLLLEYNEKEIKILVREALRGSAAIYTIDNENNFYLITPVQLQEIYGNHPDKVDTFFREALFDQSKNHFGSWRNLGIIDLLIDQISADQTLRKPTEHHEIDSTCLEEYDTTADLGDNYFIELPRDRDARLFRMAFNLYLLDPTTKLDILHEKINPGPIKIGRSTLKKAVKLETLKQKVSNLLILAAKLYKTLEKPTVDIISEEVMNNDLWKNFIDKEVLNKFLTIKHEFFIKNAASQ